MLDSLRKIARTWLGKVIGAFLIVGLAGFGISNVIFDIGTNTVARVGDEEITAREFQRAYQLDLQRFAQQTGQVPTGEQALALGIPSSTLNRLASDAAINEVAEDLGVGVSDSRLAKMLREDPTFAGTLGQFERQNFLRVLQQSGYTEAEYFALQTRAARRQQLSAALFADAAVPEAARQLVGRYAGERRRINYLILNEEDIGPVAAPTEAELAAYLSEHQDEFRTEETRQVDLLVLSPETLAATKSIGEDEIVEEFERTRQSRVEPERRRILQVPLATEEQEETFERGLAAGTSFDELVAQTGVQPVDLGLLSESQVTDRRLATAAFDLEEGAFALIPGVGRQRAVAVTEIEPGGEVPLEEVRDEIARDLALDQARDEYLDILDQIEELRAAFQPLTQIAERFDLPVRQVTLTAQGTALEQVEAIPQEERRRVATAVFAAEQDRLTPAINLGGNSTAWFDLKAIEPARDQTLDEVRDEVAAAIRAERVREALQAEAERLVAALDAGRSLDELAAAMAKEPTLSEPLTRTGQGSPLLGMAVASAAFGGDEDHHGSAARADGSRVVFEVAEVIPPEDATSEQVTAFLEQTMRDSLYSEFVTRLRDDVGLRINRQVLDQLIAGTAGQ